MAGEKWIFTKEQLSDTPSRKAGINGDTELSYRQQAANFIQDMGQRLQVTQLCINTAIVYMHRFYMFHSFKRFHRNQIAAACLFLAAKVEEQPRKLEHVIKVAHLCLHRETPPLDTKSDAYLEQAQELVCNENILLQTLGFDFTVDHPHTHVVKTCQLVRASKDLAQTSYFLATNSLHLTSMCLQYRPTVVACVCIHLACKWSSWEFPKSNEGKDWWVYVDKHVTLPLLEELTADFLTTLDQCPSKLKKKILSYKSGKEGLGGKEEKPSAPPPVKKERPSLTSPVRKDRHAPSTATLSSAQSAQSSASASSSHPPGGHDHIRSRSDMRPHGGSAAGHRGGENPSLSAQKHGIPASIAAASSPLSLPGSRSATPTPGLGKHREPQPGTPIEQQQLKRVKSETTLTPKEYLMRREREKKAAAQAVSNRQSDSAINALRHAGTEAKQVDMAAYSKEQKHLPIENSDGHHHHRQTHVQRDSHTDGSHSENALPQSIELNARPRTEHVNVKDKPAAESVIRDKPPSESPVKKPDHPHLKIKIPKDKTSDGGTSLRIKIATEHVKAEHSRHREKHKHKSERSEHHKTPPSAAKHKSEKSEHHKTPPSARKLHSQEKTPSQESPQPIKLKLSLSGVKPEISKSSRKSSSSSHKEKELKSPTKPLTIKIKDLPPPPDRQASSKLSAEGDTSKPRHNTPDRSQRKRMHSPSGLAQTTSHTPSPQPPSSKLARNDSFSKKHFSVDNLHNLPPPHIDPFMQNVPDVIFEGDMDLDSEENGNDDNKSEDGNVSASISDVQRQLEHLIQLQKAQIANAQQRHHIPQLDYHSLLASNDQPPLPPIPPQHQIPYMYAPPPPPPPE